MDKSYTYNPANLADNGKDRMRFELGDTMVEGGNETAYLTDEEIIAVLEIYPKWNHAKLALVDSVLRRFAYEVNTKVGPVSWTFNERFNSWKQLCDELKSETQSKSVRPSDTVMKKSGPPYFYGGIHDNHDLLPRGRKSCTLDQEI